MAVVSLAIKYRPKTFEDVTEQDGIKTILENQLKTGEVKNAYLFCGGAGTGKTTCARIFANAINSGKGNPIELDAASNNSVEDVRDIISRAKTASVESEYKVFILDEVHMLSNSAWNAMLKLLEEPPIKSIFIMCTTDPQKIPKTILSRVQRYDFQRISQRGIVDRLDYILTCENEPAYSDVLSDAVVQPDAIEYIAKIADGGMRDAITLLDKCLAYSTDLTIDNITKALGLTDWGTLCELTNSVVSGKSDNVIAIVEDVHSSGRDLKQFIKQALDFVLGVCKYQRTKTLNLTNIPRFLEDKVKAYGDYNFIPLLETLVKLTAEIKWDSSPKAMIEAELLLFMEGNR